jgi:hypothetical protein
MYAAKTKCLEMILKIYLDFYQYHLKKIDNRFFCTFCLVIETNDNINYMAQYMEVHNKVDAYTRGI